MRFREEGMYDLFLKIHRRLHCSESHLQERKSSGAYSRAKDALCDGKFCFNQGCKRDVDWIRGDKVIAQSEGGSRIHSPDATSDATRSTVNAASYISKPRQDFALPPAHRPDSATRRPNFSCSSSGELDVVSTNDARRLESNARHLGWQICRSEGRLERHSRWRLYRMRLAKATDARMLPVCAVSVARRSGSAPRLLLPWMEKAFQSTA